MSSDNPPYPYYNGIPFNPSFFTSDSGSGLTETTANTLYLRKTVADTSNVQETFTQPIFVSQLKGLTTASTMYVGNNITTGSVVLGNTGIRTKIDGTLETVAIRTPATGSSLIIGDTLTTGNVDIGSIFSQTYLRGTVNANTIQGIATTGDQSFFTTKTANNLNVFSSSGSTAVLNVKGSGIKFDTHSTDNPTGTQSFCSNKTAGTLNIATSQASGSINIGATGSTTTVNGTLISNKVSSSAALTDLVLNGAGSARTIIGGSFNNSTSIMTICPSSSYVDPLAISSFNDANYIITFISAAGAIRGQIAGASGSVSYQTSSDRRLKTNIEIMEPMIDKIMSLKPSKYNWKIDNQIGYGFIAQEVNQIFPELRCHHSLCCDNLDNPTNSKTGEPIYYGIDYGRFTPYIVKAFQELKEDYDAKLKFQETKLSNLEARLLALETKPVFQN